MRLFGGVRVAGVIMDEDDILPKRRVWRWVALFTVALVTAPVVLWGIVTFVRTNVSPPKVVYRPVVMAEADRAAATAPAPSETASVAREPVRVASEPIRTPEPARIAAEPVRTPEPARVASEPVRTPEPVRPVSEPVRASEPAPAPEPPRVATPPARAGSSQAVRVVEAPRPGNETSPPQMPPLPPIVTGATTNSAASARPPADPIGERIMQLAAAEPSIMPGERITGRIPLPPRRPKYMLAVAGGAVPVPRPRPVVEEESPEPTFHAVERPEYQ
jgi:hypothetical protein